MHFKFVAKRLESPALTGLAASPCGVEIIYPSTYSHSIIINSDSSGSAVHGTFANPVHVSTGTATETLIINSTAEVFLSMYAEEGNLTLIAPTSSLSIRGVTLNLAVKGTVYGEIPGANTNLLLEGSASPGRTVGGDDVGDDVKVQVNGSCDIIEVMS